MPITSYPPSDSDADHTLLELPYCAQSGELAAALRDLPELVWFDSGSAGQGQWDIISAAPDMVVEQQLGEPPLFATIAELLAAIPRVADPSLPFTGGVIALLGYAANHTALRIAPAPSDPQGCQSLPLARAGRYRWAAMTDHHSRRTLLFFDSSCSAAFIDQIRQRLHSGAAAHSPFQLTGAFAASTSSGDYRAAIAAVREFIHAGDCYQANIAQHFSAPYRGDCFAAYRALRDALASPHSGYWQWRHNDGEVALLSLSPERFIQLEQRRVETQPIKGTIARHPEPQQDRDNALWLQQSEKNRAENVMIVDLMRNDLSRCCEPRSVRVDKLFALHSYSNVHHLISSVSGTLKSDCSSAELLAECFPGGSITGAPKRRSMQIIDQLEPVGRSYYCGSLAYLSSNGRMDSSITIRTAVAAAGTIHLWGGGGIVADSDPDAEYRESLAKIALIMSTLEAL